MHLSEIYGTTQANYDKTMSYLASIFCPSLKQQDISCNFFHIVGTRTHKTS